MSPPLHVGPGHRKTKTESLFVRVARKRHGGAGAEDGVDGAALESELAQVRPRQEGAGGFEQVWPSPP